ncbi:hypothetical protein PPEP_b0617 [Pseudoalteromonas peptidolytica F12-50-A1]|uniref:Uncharacterized protein n=1 Tax=Pseudoalteromonas peptidolytica F12-50-A1 TaxID=1315280 RepID=A0A8I0N0C2_9GAMM|nr:hypothetical protein [Pseudoalteromonas peptidolytica F12-50-A1]
MDSNINRNINCAARWRKGAILSKGQRAKYCYITVSFCILSQALGIS